MRSFKSSLFAGLLTIASSPMFAQEINLEWFYNVSGSVYMGPPSTGVTSPSAYPLNVGGWFPRARPVTVLTKVSPQGLPEINTTMLSYDTGIGIALPNVGAGTMRLWTESTNLNILSLQIKVSTQGANIEAIAKFPLDVRSLNVPGYLKTCAMLVVTGSPKLPPAALANSVGGGMVCLIRY